ncbi:hypothetical protein ACGFZB_28560 [Streptomyces cinerochromogenes]|uniref:HK97 gp10 family phage protein n=1 Tax=Streptomyces cinerochromogenes TaxID=66422 RepID=A0ABW7BF11_9ACTN
MAYRSKYTGRYSGIGAMLQRPWIQAKCVAVAERAKGIAEGRSPRETGEYSRSFSVLPITKNVPFRGKPRMRAGARLINTSGHARIVEYGNGRTPRYSVLSKSIDDLKAANLG